MKPRPDFTTTAIIQSGYAAACLNLGIEFTAVHVDRHQPGTVLTLVSRMNEELWGGVLTPELESRSTNLAIMAFAGPAFFALQKGRRTFDIASNPDLDIVLDMIELRFANNEVRMTFTRYCEAEAFALFEDDYRLWRFTNLLSKELAARQKLTYEQCLDLYNKEYVVESWVRKELEEIVITEDTTEPQEPETAEKILLLKEEVKAISQKEEAPPPSKETEPRPSKRRRGGRGRGKAAPQPQLQSQPPSQPQPKSQSQPQSQPPLLEAPVPMEVKTQVPAKQQQQAKQKKKQSNEQKPVPSQAAPPAVTATTPEKPRQQEPAGPQKEKKPKAPAKRPAARRSSAGKEKK